jgi:hypothetical protein
VTTTLAILEEIQKELSGIADTDVRRAERNLAAPREGETALGAIHRIEAQRAWALANAMEARALQATITAKYNANTDEEQAAALQQAHRFKALEQIVRDLFWTQAKEDIGMTAWVAVGGVGLRSSWLLVSIPEPGAKDLLKSLLGA